MRRHLPELLFRIWGWLALPWLLGAVLLAFSLSCWFGAAFILLTAVWFYDMGATTCSRCSSYGTGRCGVQAWIVPFLWKRRSAGTVSRLRVRLHYYFDILMMAVGIAGLSFFPVLLPGFLLWLVAGWWIVYQPKKYHGVSPPAQGIAGPAEEGRDKFGGPFEASSILRRVTTLIILDQCFLPKGT